MPHNTQAWTDTRDECDEVTEQDTDVDFEVLDVTDHEEALVDESGDGESD